MLALVDNVLAEVTPVLEPGRMLYCLEASRPTSQGKGRLYLRANGQILESGVTFYKMEGEGTINPRTGHYTVPKGQTTRFRAVFANQHCDLKVSA